MWLIASAHSVPVNVSVSVIVKICDFGLARFKENTFVQTINGCAGTPNWMAPEGKLSRNLMLSTLVFTVFIHDLPQCCEMKSSTRKLTSFQWALFYGRCV